MIVLCVIGLQVIPGHIGDEIRIAAVAQADGGAGEGQAVGVQQRRLIDIVGALHLAVHHEDCA